MRVKILLLSIFLALSLPALAEKASWVRNVKAEGTWDVTGNVSLNEAKEKALYEAQKAAMRKAGVGTSVRSASFSSLSSGGENADEETFSQINSFYISGRVRLHEEPVYTQDIVNGIIRVTVSIKADVLKDQPSDPTFRLAVNGFQEMYREGDNITFTIKSSKDCYIRIFWFDDIVQGKGSILFPFVGMEPDVKLSANKVYNFPLSKDFDYEATLPVGRPKEQSFIFIVALKEPIPYMDSDATFAEFFKWYYAIDSAQRTEYYPFSFTIVK